MGEPVDGRLKALIATAERDETCPGVCVIVGSWVIQGRPVSTAEFMRATYRDYVRQVATPVGSKISGNKEERSRLMGEHLRPFMAAFGYKSDADALALSLADASVSGSTGPVLKVPALRIPVSAVQTWWSAGFEVDPGKGFAGGGISVGFNI
ncbi:hypothetical protein [Pseudarthrobacter sp. S9]|uniref:hypothetical protein n=1 Tax=Pseudarthrobacter sp. S9 TaxID=3418421 RepID=UPI003CFF7106